MWHKGVQWHHVESDSLKEGPGTKTSWEVRDCRTPKKTVSKCCLKQIPKVTSILVLNYYHQRARHNSETKENKKWHSTQEQRTAQKYSPIECDGVQLHEYWMTLLLYVIYTSYNRTHIENAYISYETLGLVFPAIHSCLVLRERVASTKRHEYS